MFLEKSKAQIATLQFLKKKWVFTLRFCQFLPLSNQVSHGVLPARVRVCKSCCHTTCNLTRQEERGGTQKWGWQKGEKMLHNIFFSHGILRKGWKENKRGKRGGKEVVATFSWDSSIDCCSNHVLSSKKEGGKKHMGAEGIRKSVPSPFLNPSFHHLLHTLTNTHLPEDVMSQTWRGENLHFSFPCVSKLTCRFTWQRARPSASVWFCECAATRCSVYVLANRQIMCIHLNVLVCAFVRPCTCLLEIWHAFYRTASERLLCSQRHC